jgi:hypothetical protein
VNTRQPASDAQLRYVITLATKVYALPSHEHHALGYRARHQYAVENAKGMTAAYASLCIDAMKERLAAEA